MKIIQEAMKRFLTVQDSEEPVDQPLYHFQSYGTGGATSFAFFSTAVGGATNGFSDTNMDSSNTLSAGKRFAVNGIAVAFLASAPQVFNAVSTASALNDARGVLEGTGNFVFKVLDKPYLQVAPLSYLPAGFGLFIGGAAYQRTQGSAGDGNGFIAHANNGMPLPGALRRLHVPIPIPAQTKFEATIAFNSAVTISTASRLGVILDGVLIRARQ